MSKRLRICHAGGLLLSLPWIGRDARPAYPSGPGSHRWCRFRRAVRRISSRARWRKKLRDRFNQPAVSKTALARTAHSAPRSWRIASGRGIRCCSFNPATSQPDSVQESAIRSGSRPRAGFEPRLRPHDSGRAPVAPGRNRCGSWSPSARSRPGELHYGSAARAFCESLRGVVQFDGRRPDNPHSLKGRAPRSPTCSRAGSRLLHEPASFPSLSQGREAARARSDQPPALADYPGAAHHR